MIKNVSERKKKKHFFRKNWVTFCATIFAKLFSFFFAFVFASKCYVNIR